MNHGMIQQPLQNLANPDATYDDLDQMLSSWFNEGGVGFESQAPSTVAVETERRQRTATGLLGNKPLLGYETIEVEAPNHRGK